MVVFPIIVFLFIFAVVYSMSYSVNESEKYGKAKKLSRPEKAIPGAVIIDLEPRSFGSKLGAHFELVVHFSDSTTYRDSCNSEEIIFNSKRYWFDKEKAPKVIQDAIAAHESAAKDNYPYGVPEGSTSSHAEGAANFKTVSREDRGKVYVNIPSVIIISAIIFAVACAAFPDFLWIGFQNIGSSTSKEPDKERTVQTEPEAYQEEPGTDEELVEIGHGVDKYGDTYYVYSGGIFEYETERSTAISRVAYFEEYNILFIQFRDSGESYAYYDFSKRDFNKFIESESLGKYFNQNIKDKYEYEQVE